MTPSSLSARPWSAVGTGAAAIAACAVCCAVPVLSVLGGIGVVSAVGAGWIPVLAVLALLAGLGVVWVWRRRRAAACQVGEGVVDLGMPTIAPTLAKGPVSGQER